MAGKATVFGGSGFLGRHLVRRLATAGWQVQIAARDIEKAALLKPCGEIGQIVPLQTDINDPRQVAGAVADADAVINLVGILFESGRNRFASVHADAAGTVAAAAKAAGTQTLVHVSALGADKDSEARYARSKAAGEEAVMAAFPGATVLRPSVVFGPEDNFFNMFAGMTRLTPVLPVYGCPTLPKISFGDDGLDVDLYGDGGTKFQPVYVGDVADAIMAALEIDDARGRCYELAGPTVYGFKALLDLLLKVTERKRFLVPVPFAMAEFQALFLELLPKPLLTRDQVALLKTDNVFSGDNPGLVDLGIEATAAEAILPTYLKRFRTPAHQGLQDA